ncbi:MAG: hypothetical protein CMD62_02725 [Gammaproteobacteria bacterium]|jgi:hypothetical protein|nr:hypothetical protein [Gammaproteobacteria bacterium]|tara:strand:- start:9357 stop:10043 length:687 start_codon:yes stop_codon:yes gene_type:complete
MNSKLNQDELLSLFLDNEMDHDQLNKFLEELKTNSTLKEKYKTYVEIDNAVNSLSQMNQRKRSNIFHILKYRAQKHSKIVSALAATIILSIGIVSTNIVEFKSNNYLIADAVSSVEAQTQFELVNDELIQHVIYLTMSDLAMKNDLVNPNWLPVGFVRNPKKLNEFTNGDEAFAVHIEKNYINLDQPKYWVNDDDVIYLHPLKDGRLVSIVGNIRPDLANKVLISLDK